MEYSNELLMELYKKLVFLRRNEEAALENYATGRVPGHVHSGFGEEAIFAAAFATMQEKDWVKPTYRSYPAVCWRGATLKGYFAHSMAKDYPEDENRSNLRAMDRMIPYSGALGSALVTAVGVAWAMRNHKEDGICYAFLGDGTCNKGEFHEAANMAAIWKLPVIWIVDNNGFAISTPTEYSIPIENIADRAAGYNMPGVVADGNDILSSYKAIKEMSDYVRAGNGPALVECKTYRMRGHFEGDQTRYRSKEVTEAWAKRDCVKGYEAYLTEKKLLTDEIKNQIYAEIDQEIEEAIQFAIDLPEQKPTMDNIFNNIYVD